MAIKIPLSGKLGNGKFVLIDEEDDLIVSGRRWYLSNRGYAVTTYREKGKHCLIQLHRLITGAPSRVLVDHINRDRLDNRRSNLRIVTYSDNARNRGAQRGSSSPYKGVSLRKESSMWCAMISYKYQNIFIGSFKDPEDAAYAYDQFAIHFFGDSAFTNIL